MAENCIVLLSGGLDSATCLSIAIREGFDPYCLTFRYGQRHSHELECAMRVAEAMHVRDHRVLDLDLRALGGSALTDDVPVPKSGIVPNEIPVTYVPARNTIFLSYALAFAEVVSAQAIFIGVNALDYSGYPDCRAEFIDAFERLARVATRDGVEGSPTKILTPLIGLTKAEIVTRAVDLGVDLSRTSSCYDPAPDGTACGLCDACRLRLRGFAEAGVSDPVRYQTEARA